MRTKLSSFSLAMLEAGWLAAIVTVPLVFNIHTARIYEPVKITLLRSIVDVMAFCWFVLAVERAGREPNGTIVSLASAVRRWLRVPLVLPALALVVAHVVSTIYSITPVESMWGSHTRLSGTYTCLCYVFIFFVIAQHLRTQEQLERLLTAVIVTSVPVCLYGIFQHYALDPYSLYTGSDVRVCASLGNPIFLAAYLILVVPLTLARLSESALAVTTRETVSLGHILSVVLYALILVIQLATITFSQSRGPMLGLLGALFFMGLLAMLRVRRRLGVGWLGIALIVMLLLVGANMRGGPLAPFFEPVREVPYLKRLINVFDTEHPSVKFRLLVWDATMKLAVPHRAIGIPGDVLAGEDMYNPIRPVIGYGPESIFNVFPSVYPPELAHIGIEGPTSSPDRSHNETLDTLATTGVLGFLAYYLFTLSLFYYALCWLGFAADRLWRRRLAALLMLGGIIGTAIAYVADGTGSHLTYVALGLPFGVLAGMLVYLLWQSLMHKGWAEGKGTLTGRELLLIALLSAVIGHFIEVQFAFSVSATYLYFWLYAGLLVAVTKMSRSEMQASSANDSAGAESAHLKTSTPPRALGSKERRRSQARAEKTPARTGAFKPPAPPWIVGQSLIMGLILSTLAFGLISPRSQMNTALVVMFVITWLLGLVPALVAIRQGDAGPRATRMQTAMIYAVISLGWCCAYALIHRIHLWQWQAVTTVDRVISAADVVANSWLLFCLCVLLFMVLFAVIQIRNSMWGLAFWHARTRWLYPAAAVGILGLIWFKDMGVVRADIYLNEAERYSEAERWDQAIALHEKARSADGDDHVYHLKAMTAYQGLALDENCSEHQRARALEQGEQAGLEALRVNPYNPDNLANLARYYLKLRHILGPEALTDAVALLEKLTQLAPFRTTNHNLLAQAHYVRGDNQAAIERLRRSLSVDDRFPSTWLLLSDAYFTMGEMEQALAAQGTAMRLVPKSADGFARFTDKTLDRRLKTYIAAGKLDDLVSVLQGVAVQRPDDALAPWTIGHAYYLADRETEALPYFQQALSALERLSQTAPAGAEIHLRLGEAYQVLGQTEAAVRAFRRATTRSSPSATAYFKLGVALSSQSRYEAAARAFAEALKLDHENASGHKNLGLMLFYHLDRRDDGVKHFKRSLELNPGQPGAAELAKLIASHEKSPQKKHHRSP